MGSDAIIAAIEAPAFGARLSVVSTPTAFIRALAEQPELHALEDQLRTTPVSRASLLQEIAHLAHRDIDLRYEHPWDIVLAAFLWSFARVDEGSALIATSILRRTPNLWWATRIADSIEKHRATATPSTQTILALVGHTYWRTTSNHTHQRSLIPVTAPLLIETVSTDTHAPHASSNVSTMPSDTTPRINITASTTQNEATAA